MGNDWGWDSLWKGREGQLFENNETTERLETFFLACKEGRGAIGIPSAFHLAGFSPSSCYPPSLPWVPFHPSRPPETLKLVEACATVRHSVASAPDKHCCFQTQLFPWQRSNVSLEMFAGHGFDG